MRGWVVLAALSLFASGQAQADERAAAREHYAKGTKAFELGLYDEAIGEYMAAYKAKDEPALLYNIAQSHRLAGHSAEALRFYRMYLLKAPRAQNRDEVQIKLVELQKLIEQQKRAQNLPPDQVRPLAPPPAAETAPTAEPEPLPASPPPLATAQTATPTPTVSASRDNTPSRGRATESAGISVAVVGIALVAAGAAMSGVAAKDSSDLTTLDRNMQPFDPSKQQTGQALGIAGPVLLAVGGLAAIAGITVAILGHRESKRRAVALTPLPGPHVAAAWLRFSN
jgi:tetratricopeptide (TPR) repeat protein